MGQTVRYASLGSTRLLRGESRRNPYERPSAAEFYGPEWPKEKKRKKKPPKTAKVKQLKRNRREGLKPPILSESPETLKGPDIGCLCGWRGPSLDFNIHTTFPVEQSREHGRIDLSIWIQRREAKRATLTKADSSKPVG